MNNITSIQGAPSSLPRPSRFAQINTPVSRITQSDILGQWEHDRFGTVGAGSGLNASRWGEHRQERSTVSSWQAFAQSHTSMPLPPLRGRKSGVEGVQRNEELGTGAAGVENRRLTKFPTTPPQEYTRGHAEESSYIPRRVPTPRSQTWRKRKSEIRDSQNGWNSNSAPQVKRASPDRSSPLSAAVAGDRRSSGDVARREITQQPRKPGFEPWVSSRTRGHIVAPNGIPIIPNGSQPGKSFPRHQQSTSTPHQVIAQNIPDSVPERQPVKSILSPQQRHPSCHPWKTSTATPSTLAPADTSTATSPSKSRAKTTDDIARRLIFAGIGAGRAPKRTEEELRKRHEEQERRRIQREERENMGKDEVMKWCGLENVKSEVNPFEQAVVKKSLIRSSTTMEIVVKELTRFNGKEIQW
ncbi:hypothetical protein ONS95_008929 [Cadophora gregata]|uniref:uncharacterized protein n=1 Tax=Cadophora gregata TaxID=51156 RepID=UPI0026DD1B74|nr:uncharacterized protein ONS95_008929 [Cadophora gregata]KAK0123939.1 hypothetical protein ONS95_008929 [Cadophora gregata]